MDGMQDEARSYIETLLSEVYEPEGVRIWMKSPHRWFMNKTPLELISEGRSTDVIAAVNILIDGAFA